MVTESENTPWMVLYSRSAIDFISRRVASKKVAQKIFRYRELLAENPDLGRNYQPEYAAAVPPFPCRFISVPDTPFTLFYFKDEKERKIVIFCVEFQRTDPVGRFVVVDWVDL